MDDKREREERNLGPSDGGGGGYAEPVFFEFGPGFPRTSQMGPGRSFVAFTSAEYAADFKVQNNRRLYPILPSLMQNGAKISLNQAFLPKTQWNKCFKGGRWSKRDSSTSEKKTTLVAREVVNGSKKQRGTFGAPAEPAKG
ncbi:hypothetical protein DFH06DRAFT_1138630 [Mycena polygramma]|nr:hypothetical protein DFH06DRAFT_1138630 [Mycena polygramma]